MQRAVIPSRQCRQMIRYEPNGWTNTVGWSLGNEKRCHPERNEVKSRDLRTLSPQAHPPPGSIVF